MPLLGIDSSAFSDPYTLYHRRAKQAVSQYGLLPKVQLRRRWASVRPASVTILAGLKSSLHFPTRHFLTSLQKCQALNGPILCGIKRDLGRHYF